MLCSVNEGQKDPYLSSAERKIVYKNTTIELPNI